MKPSVAPKGRIARYGLEDVPILMVLFAFAIGGGISRSLLGVPGEFSVTPSHEVFAVLTAIYLCIATPTLLAHLVLVGGRSLRDRATWERATTTIFAPAALFSYAVLFAAIPVLIRVFVAFKMSIPQIAPFSWDATLMEWDRRLHFGNHPFAMLQPIVGRAIVTRAIDTAYVGWVPLMWMTVIWQSWHGSRSTPHRSQFLLAFVLSWVVLGTLLAIAFSSAGPAYFGLVTDSPNPYVPLMTYLHSVGGESQLSAVQLQAILWNAFVAPQPGPAGISAMPSMHVSIAVLMALLGFAINSWLGWAYATYAVIILVGSIHLGWHYAVDGYAAIVATGVIWVASGHIVQRWRTYLDVGAEGSS